MVDKTIFKVKKDKTIFIDNQGREWTAKTLESLVNAVHKHRQAENSFKYYFDDEFDFSK
jgi:hypothetical protein